MKRAGIALAAGVVFAMAASSAATAREVLPWREDFTKAVAEARAKNVPIFVEAWAPW